MHRWWLVLLVLLAPLAQAATVHAFLDRTHVSVGDTVTLNLQSSGALGNPDLSPLQKDFDVLGTSRSRSVQIVNGSATSTSQLGIALKPLHAGTLTIPALQVGGGQTAPLTLQVGAAPSGGTGKVGDPVFMEANVLSSSPWVGQQTVYTVRLFYLPGVDGALGNPDADGGRLVELDRDHRYVAERDGYTYNVIERSWALIPQRSGAITVRGPVFQGQRLGGGNPPAWFNNPNALLNNPNALLNGPVPGFGTTIHAVAPVARIEARSPPPNAGKPWLPARSVELKLTGLPTDGKVDAGTPLTVTLSIRATGQSAAALPDPQLPPIVGARVYPDQTRDATDDTDKWLQGTRTRSFAIVPERNGELEIPAITLAWWNVAQNRAEQAKVPARTLTVTGVVAGSAPPAAPPVAAATAGATPASSGANPVASAAAPSASLFPWRDVAWASLALWALVVAVAAWWLWSQRRKSAAPQVPQAPRATVQPVPGSAGMIAKPRPDPSGAKVDVKALQQRSLAAAQAGDAEACERALLAWARAIRPGMVSAGSLRDALADPSQREALDALERARWQGADAASACEAVTRAFARRFAWRDHEPSARADAQALPPLYPPP